MALSGSCEYCGQSMVLDEGKYPLLDPENQEAIDNVVTGLCDCPQAKSERRKVETQKKIEEYLENEIDPAAKPLMEAAVEAIRTYGAETVQVLTNDGWKVKVHIDKDGYLVFDCKKTDSKKTKI